jgi:hypothetical protein
MDLVNKVIDWENGDMSGDDETQFFQELVNSGMAWQLQGMYGRRAMELIRQGKVFQYAHV